jgi:hypothetical protein
MAMEATNMFQRAGASALLGVMFHLCIQAIDFELVMFHYMAFSTFVFLGIVYVAGFLNAVLLATSFNTGLLSSMAVYRIFLHRCREFPGPVGAKLTKFYAMRLSAKDTQYYKELASMHNQYGDIVRTGPREISVLRKSAVPLLYGPKSECLKSTWYGQTGNDPKKTSIHMTRDVNLHRLRRRAWDKCFSIKGTVPLSFAVHIFDLSQ